MTVVVAVAVAVGELGKRTIVVQPGLRGQTRWQFEGLAERRRIVHVDQGGVDVWVAMSERVTEGD